MTVSMTFGTTGPHSSATRRLNDAFYNVSAMVGGPAFKVVTAVSVSPVIGFAIIAFVLVNADVHAKVGGVSWLAIGAIVLVGLRLAGRSVDLKLEPETGNAGILGD